MIEGFGKKDCNRDGDKKALAGVIAVFLFIVWLCTPPGNKFAQICFYGNKTQFFVAKLTTPVNELNEHIFHRNNAIYLTQMERKYASLMEMDRAVATAPNYISEGEMSSLYSDRAQIRLFWGEYKSSLDDYLRMQSPNIMDMFKIALLYKKIGNNKYAFSYCNDILNIDPNAYIGYACVADVYAGVGRYESSVKVYDILIDRVQNRARYYVERAAYKKLSGDFDGAEQDMKKAKELSPILEKEFSIIEETIKPKKLTLTIM